ncbi:AAA family ATPase [Fimbriiglobus ruber]|uniref:ATPase n=1 Tax=Fimbriiglobus ruber TaxID=1908690 RepID=A0A225DV84_9BACT|nr:ATP-binding protein [Fimbriiglobus ruber]OWK45262.1 ATPase [Fimbriiglobus ruber]
MKLAKVRIENFRQLGSAAEPFELDFTDALGRVRDFTLLVGPNGCGKTTILDAIAAAIGPTLEMPTLRPGFKRSPRTIVPRGAPHAKVTCWLRFDQTEIDTTREVYRLAELNDPVPDAQEVTLTWTYPDPRQKSDYGFTQCEPPTSWTLLKARIRIAHLLATGRVEWDWFNRAGGVFTFDQERTGLGKTISRQIWNIIHGTAESAKQKSSRRTTDPRTILIALALQALVPLAGDGPRLPGQFDQIRKRYAHVCSPRRIVGAVRDELGEFDIFFDDGQHEYSYAGLSSGEKMALLLLIRFVSEHMHRSLILIDELELNEHPLWQRRLLHMIPQMGDGNQIIATTHSPYLRDAVPPDSVCDLGDLGDGAKVGGE